MAKNTYTAPAMNQGEIIWGWGYLIFELVLFPSLLQTVNGLLSHPLGAAELNFLFFLINFLAVILIFHRFLGKSFANIRLHPAYFCQGVILGLCAYFACSWAVNTAIRYFVPGFTNVNDNSIAALAGADYFLTALGTVVLVPLAEECFYRGLLFRTLWSRSKVLAYGVSMAAFALVHVLGYVGTATPVRLLLCFLQYLPAGLCLGWTYTKTNTIYAPVLAHMVINAMAVGLMR